MNLRESLGVLFIIVLMIYAFSSDFLVVDSGAKGSNSVMVSRDMPFLSLRNNIQVYSDASRSLSLEEVMGAFYAEQFRFLSIDNASRGFTQDWVWYRVKLHNQELERVRLILEVRFPLLDNVEGYIVTKSDQAMHVMQRFNFGDRYSFEQRVIKTPYFTQPINFYEENVWLYLKVSSNSSMEFPAYLGGYDAYIEHATYRQWGLGLVYGIALALVFYNFVLYVSLKDLVHLYYALFTIGLFAFFACLDGFAYRLWPNNIEWQTKADIYSVYYTLIFSVLFSRRFMGINKKTESYFRSTNGLVFLVLFCSLATPFLEEVYASFVMSISVVVVTLSLFLLGIYRMRDGAPMSDFYVVIWGTLIVVTIFSVIASFGILFEYEKSLNLMKAVSVVQLVLLSIAVGYKLNAMRDKQIRAEQHARRFSQEARKAEKHLLEVQIESNKLLEKRVSDRTLQLEDAMAELNNLNKKLTKLSEIDGLTGLYNRRKLEAEYDNIAKIALLNGDVLGLLFVDIDYFKRFNDSYGHDVGDECLRQVSTMMKRFSEKYQLVSGRLGGEEFVLIDKQSHLLRLQDIAEKFRSAVARERFLHRGHELSVTVSIGGCLPSKDIQANRSCVMHEADAALYQAKKNGRNCVVVSQYNGTLEQKA